MVIEKTLRNLRKNGMEVVFVESKGGVVPAIEKLIGKGDAVSVGGSVTLFECGVVEFLRKGDYVFLDRYGEGMTRDEIEDVFFKAKNCDAYICGSNAITENGELYNVDGHGNRLSAIAHGPKTVIIVAGVNKIVADLDAAVYRVKTVAAPKNSERVKADSYCRTKGKCASLHKENPEMTDGCESPSRICGQYLVTGRQRAAGRIKIVLVNEDLGY